MKRVHLLANTSGLSFRVEQVRAGYPGAEAWVREEEMDRLREALTEAVEVVHKAYVAATMEAVNAGPTHPLRDQMEKWRLRCLRAEEAGRAALAALPLPPGGDDEGDGAE